LKGRAGFAHQSAKRSAHLDVFAASSSAGRFASIKPIRTNLSSRIASM